jgi:hypothetical protein
MYSSAQKNLNDHSIWHNFFVFESIGLKFWLNLHKSIVHFLEGYLLSERSYDFLSSLVRLKSI